MGEVWLLADFDGTLMDTYTNTPKALNELLGEEKGARAYRLMLELSARGIHDPREFLKEFAPERELQRYLERFYELRIEHSSPREGALEAVRNLRAMGIRFGILCSPDPVPGMKRRRILASPFAPPLAEAVLIVGETCPSRRECVESLRANLVFVVDDLVGPLKEVSGIPNVVPVRILPPKSVRGGGMWEGEFDPTLGNWDEVRAFVLNFIEGSYARKRVS